MGKSPDPRQPSLFDRPPRRPGSMQFGAELRSAIAQAIKDSGKSRPIIAGEMTDLLFGELAGEGAQVTTDQLNSWTAPSREAWRFPLEYLPAFVEATAAYQLLDIIAEHCGCQVLFGEEAKLAMVAAIQHERARLRVVETELKSGIDPGAAERLLQRKGGGRP